jgi:pimeloyl-ACP methyl ester carboxylesterase
MNSTKQGIAALHHGINIYYETFGNENNPAILLIMGLDTQCVAFTLEFIKPLLENNFYCIRFDNRDIGKSTWLNEKWNKKSPYTLEDMAQDTLGLLDYLDQTKVHLLGVSMGGMIAQRIAISYPERVNSICSVMSSAYLHDQSLLKNFLEKLYSPFLPFIFKHFYVKHPILHPKITVKYYMNMYRFLNGKVFKYEEEGLREIITEALEKREGQNPKARYQQYCAILASGSRIQEISKINKPFLIIHGTADPIIPVSHAYKMASLNKSAILVIVDGMGHTFPKESYPFFYPELLNHLSKS